MAVEAGGGVLTNAEEADGIVWTNPADPQGLKDLLELSPARWVQLPFAGIESFVAAGVIDPELVWTCAKGAYGPACAEHALALMLAASRMIQRHARATTWRQPGLGSPERRLEGATVVLLGTGGIGAALVPMLEPHGVRVIGVNRSGRPLEGAERTVTAADLAKVAGDADYLVITAALTEETRGMVDAEVLESMPESAWVVNVARGGLVDTDALVEALKTGKIAGAALDVTDPEPLPDGHPLWSMDNVLITPHVANTWDMAVPELRALVERNVRKFVGGEELEGIVDVESGY